MSETARKAEGPEAGAPRQDVSGAGAKAPEAPQASVPAEAPAPQGSQGQAGAKTLDAEPEGEAVARIQPARQQVALTPEMLQQLAKAGVKPGEAGSQQIPPELLKQILAGQAGQAGVPAQAGGLPAGMPLGMGAQGPQKPEDLTLDQARAIAGRQGAPTRRRVERDPSRMDKSLALEEVDKGVSASNAAGFASFLKSIFLGGRLEQSPDKDLGTMLQQAMAGQGQPGKRSTTMGGMGLFAAMDAPLRGLTPDDVKYASDVDAAYSRRPKFGARFLSVFIFIFFGVLLAWSAFAEIDEVTHSEGSVVGSRKTQSISNLEGGILRSMLVREGQEVSKGDVIAQLDNEMAASAYRDAVNRTMDDSIALIRLEAELKGIKPSFPTDLKAWARELLGRDPEPEALAGLQQKMRDQQTAYETRLAKYKADEAVLEAQIAQRQKDVQEQKAHRDQLSGSLSLASQQRDAAQGLLSRRNFSRIEFLNLEQKVVELRGQLDMLNASIPRAEASAAEAQHRIASHKAEYESGITEEINKRRAEQASLRETLSAGSDRVTRTDVRSPVRGIVKQIYVNTIGGTVKPGEPILDITPLDDTLLVEARVKPQDVAFLRPGQDVMVKITAYDFSIYGGLDGKLEQISADTIEDKRGEFYYLVKVRTKKTALVYHNEVLPIIPGMMVQADILIGKKTVLQYMLKPILKAKQNALTER